jgi:hypothetical protein
MVNNTSSSFITIEHEKNLVYEPLISYDEHYNELTNWRHDDNLLHGNCHILSKMEAKHGSIWTTF